MFTTAQRSEVPMFTTAQRSEVQMFTMHSARRYQCSPTRMILLVLLLYFGKHATLLFTIQIYVTLN